MGHRLTQIATRTGDDGSTGLADGRRLAEREGVDVPAHQDWAALEAHGWQRQRAVMRLSLVRHVFRRPLEVWLALDRALYLERVGYRVRLAEFCGRELTPRNLLISARR